MMLTLVWTVAFAASAAKEPVRPDLDDPEVRLATQVQVLDALVHNGMSGQALEMIQKIHADGVDDVRIDVIQARALDAAGMKREATSVLESSVKRHKRDADAWNTLGILHADLGDVDTAIADLQRAARLRPRDAEIHNNLGYALLADKQLEAASRELQTALGLDPSNPRIRNNLGFALARRKLDPEALEAFRAAALAEGGGEAEARYNMGLACEQRGEVDAALVQYQAAVAARPDHPLANAALTRLLKKE